MNITNYKNIKEQMTEMIFDKRNIKYDRQLFDAYYNRMFPALDEIRCFLGTSGRDTMQNAAKKIADRLLFDSIWNGTQFFFDNLLSFETKNVSDTCDGYVPQDHVVHSVHVYLLGLYCYFNFSVFHDTLFRYFSEMNIKSEYSYTKKEKSFEGFLEAWKSFAFLHDVAYPFEAIFDAEGRLKQRAFKEVYSKYMRMSEYMCYYAAMKYFSGLILLYMLTGESDYELSQEFSDENEEGFEKYSKAIRGKERYRKLHGVYFNEDYKACSQYFDKEDSVVLIKNKEYDLVGILIRTDTGNHLIKKDNLGQDEEEILSCIMKASRLEVKRRGLHLEFYINENIDEILEKGLRSVHLQARVPYIKEMSKNIKEKLSVRIAAASESNNLLDIRYQVMVYLTEKCPPEICIPAKSFASAIPENILKDKKILLRSIILDKMRECVDKVMGDYQAVLTVKQVTEILETIEKFNWNDYFSGIGEIYYSAKFQKDADVINVIDAFQKISHEFMDDADGLLDDDKDFFSNIYKNFSKNVEHAFMQQICKLLEKENFIKDGNFIDDFLRYKREFSCYDHGIAAGILMAVYFHRKKLLHEKLRRKKIPVPEEQSIYMEPVVEQAVYAILMHNIYSKQYELICKNAPKHTLLLNPVSYYGMFCDNLQVWDRNKGLDFGLVKWTGNTLYGEDISICFEDSKIRVICRTQDIVESFKKFKRSLEEYLTGSMTILTLSLLESNQE